MTTKPRLVLIFSLFLWLLVGAWAESRSGEDLVVEDDLADIGFFAAGELTLDMASSDDVIAAGGEVVSRRLEGETLILAGGDVRLRGLAVDDAFVTGGSVTLEDGEILDDLTLAGGDVTVRSGLRIGGTVHAAGGELNLLAPVGGDLRAAGGEVTLDAPVEGNVELAAETLVIGPDTRIAGNLRYRAKNADVSPSAVIAGDVVALQPPAGREERVPGIFAAMTAFGAMVLSAGLVAVVVAAALPALVVSAEKTVRDKPLSSIGIGLLIVLLGPAAVGLLMVTVIGIPLALVLLVALFLLLPIGLAGIAYAIGMVIRSASRGEDGPPGAGGRAFWAFLGFLAVALISLVPVAGALVWIALAVLGSGAVARAAFGLLARTRTPQPV